MQPFPPGSKVVWQCFFPLRVMGSTCPLPVQIYLLVSMTVRSKGTLKFYVEWKTTKDKHYFKITLFEISGIHLVETTSKGSRYVLNVNHHFLYNKAGPYLLVIDLKTLVISTGHSASYLH